MEMGSGSESVPGASDSLNGLMFGKKIYFEDAGAGAGAGAGGRSSSKALTVAGPVSVPSAVAPPPKKGKWVAQGGGGGGGNQQQQPPRCQVEGCKMDLSGAKAYYCRHKVCGMHSKSPKVVVAGIEQRFCQQCSRFHQLHEFDQGKRSCRRRLAGHNERRRKPPPGPLSPRYGRLSSSFYEDNSRFRSFLMDFSYPRTQSPSRDIWPTVRDTDRVAGGGQWHGNPSAPSSEVVTHPYIPPSSRYMSEHPPGECFAGVSDSSCALSLLSNQPWGTTAPRNRAPNISASSSDGVPVGQQMFGTSTCLAHPWGFKNHSAGCTSHEVEHAMGLGHFDEDGNGQFSGELELALQGNRHCPQHGTLRAYDHPCNGMHWSL